MAFKGGFMKKIILFLNIVSMGVVFAAHGGGIADQKPVLPGLVVAKRERSDGSVLSVDHLVQAFGALGQDDEPARADDSATQSTQYSDADVVPLDKFSWPEVGDGPRIQVAAGAQHDASNVHSEDAVRPGLYVSSVHSGVGDAGLPGTSEDEGHADAEHGGSDVHLSSSVRLRNYAALTQDQLQEMRSRVTLVLGDQQGDVDPRKKK
jgi:hypothetical protein